MADGFGAITWWGFSPALDLQENCQCKCKFSYFGYAYCVLPAFTLHLQLVSVFHFLRALCYM